MKSTAYRVAAILGLAFCFMGQAVAQTSPGASTPDSILAWMSQYRSSPSISRVPGAVKSLSQAGALKDPETSGTYVGFMAGVLGANPKNADKLVAQMLPLPFQDQWALVRAIAYSGLPDWKGVLRKAAPRLKDRQAMIDLYLNDKLLPLEMIPLEAKPKPGFMERIRGVKADDEESPQQPFSKQPELIDTLWGMYFATGKKEPILRLVGLLAWSKERDNIDKLTMGSMAKFTLATNASRDAKLLAIVRDARQSVPKNIEPVLGEVIEAAETVDTARVRKEAVAAMELLKTRGPGSRRDMAMWGKVSEGVISAGCVVAAVTGQVYLGLPCVVGGALATGAVHYLATP